MTEAKEAIFRSADMSLVQLYIPQEIARETVYTIGQLGLVQFRDLNSKVTTFQRSFVDDIKRLDNVERQYRYFYKLLKKHGIKFFEEDLFNEEGHVSLAPSTAAIDDYVQSSTYLEERLIQMEDAAEQLEQQKADLEQYRFVLKSAEEFFAKDPSKASGGAPSYSENDEEAGAQGLPNSVSYVTGVISRDKVEVLEQILWRVLRGNLYFRHAELSEPVYDPNTKGKVSKNAFIVFSHGDLIMKRIQKVAESLDGNLYNVDENSEARSNQLAKVNQSLNDLYTVLQTTTTTLESELYAIAKELDKWIQDISREKSVFETLNKFNFDVNHKTLIAEGWVPEDELVNLQDQLGKMTSELGVDVPSIIEVMETNRTPPTFHRTNKLTSGFQNICDCYGIAQYKEVNAGLPTVVTFPFMFAIMFGDLGHGFIMSLAAGAIVWNETKIGKMKRGEMFDMIYAGRYVVLLMGVFSMYTGFLYNDVFSRSMTFFKSGWEWPEHWKEGESIVARQVSVYPVGLDWFWHGAENSLLFANSYKMKLSILMGFIHMTYSYFFSLANHIFFKSWIDIVANFIPGLLFMQGIFGYLSVCIVYKWSVDWVKDDLPAPSLLNMLINMFLAPGVVDEELYPHQAKIQVFLVLMALICVPCLLLIKPLHYKFTQKEHQPLPTDDEMAVEQLTGENGADYDNEEESGGHEDGGFGDVMIHQVIHTIEFCLNCVSHTASYLRLWALSLAHAQLSQVLWSMTIALAFGVPGILGVTMTVCLFAMWFVLTVAILVGMEGTSAMLHSLRLHWVESMSKFFVGEGTLYEPFLFIYKDLDDEANPTPGAA
ncbi:hypothetical protein HG535_0A06500 [Zygotorulaspora mrakii]|uniref:V-type proton ATPase subunit a n=1 Tax=Zygotorulaspora mrakii TaxID=42260 RepID=A0A7H9AWD1_ZYGMR|nr:uncharacterized protein HG535_0A06500 [Zygotorulaspora mrakii]QLG70708.1 hypothetical protein HG535_0A06500 [Zygotorulaspora mrakii]